MTATEILKLIEPIPANKFITDRFSDHRSKCCVIGHVQRLTSKDPKDYSWDNCNDRWGDRTGIRKLSEQFIQEKYDLWESIATVNNEPIVNNYTEKSIKARVVHLLKDMIEAGY